MPLKVITGDANSQDINDNYSYLESENINNKEQLSLKADQTDLDITNLAVSALGSGAPGGVYATLAALTAALPTGDDQIYVVTDDGHWYYWDGSAWTDGGTYQATGIAEKSLSLKEMNDFISGRVSKASRWLGDEVYSTVDLKDLSLLTSISSRDFTTRIVEAPANAEGLVTLFISSPFGNGDITIMIIEKNDAGQFKVVDKEVHDIFKGEQEISTNLIIKVGQYVGVYSKANYYFRTTTKTTYSLVAELGDTFETFSTNTAFDLSWYYQIGRGVDRIADIDNNLNNVKAALGLYVDYVPETINPKLLSTRTLITSDAVGGTFRVNGYPATKDGALKVYCKFTAAGNTTVYILEKEAGANSFKEINKQNISVQLGENEILTDLIIRAGQYVAITSDDNLYYDSISGIEYTYSLSVTDITDFVPFNLSTTIDYAFYYELVAPAESQISKIEGDINALKVTPLYKAINTIYTEKFLDVVAPTPPFGVWEISGGIYDNGVTLTPALDFTAYLQLTQPTHIDSDGVKWRIKINDNTSRLRVERRTSMTSSGGFTSTAEYNNGVLNIFQVPVNFDSNPTTVIASKTLSMAIVNGREYIFTLEVFGEILKFAITDTVTGETETLTFTSTLKGSVNAGRGWDYPKIYLLSGDVKILQFDYFSRLPKSPKFVALGDSILEADTIRNLTGGGYTKRWAGLLYEKLKGDGVIMGTAGETSTHLANKIPVISKALGEPEYALLAHMTNDTEFSAWQSTVEQLITLFESRGTIPVICMMPMRAGRESFYDSVLAYVEASPYKVIWFNRALTVGGDGKTIDTQYYTGDNLHPNVLGHKRMYEQVLADLDEMFPVDYI